jgi:hypothetical protein
MARSVLRQPRDAERYGYVQGLVHGLRSGRDSDLENFREGIARHAIHIVRWRDAYTSHTALMSLVHHGKIDLAGMLLDAAARLHTEQNVPLRGRSKVKNLTRALLNQRDSTGRTALDFAYGNKEMKRMLREHGANIRLMQNPEGWPPGEEPPYLHTHIDCCHIGHGNQTAVPVSPRVRQWLRQNPE